MILDTNALSALAEGDAVIRQRLRMESANQVPAIVLGEYRFGLKNSRLRVPREAWLEEAERIFQVLPVDRGTALAYADLRQQLKVIGRPIPENDLWIAALAVQHGLPVLTRDSHFSTIVGVTRISW